MLDPCGMGERILLTCPVNGEDAVLGYDWEGEKLWQTTLGKERKGKHRNGSGSNPSVVTDGESIFSLFKSGNFAGLDFTGKVLWKTNLSGYGKDSLYWDFGTSPDIDRETHNRGSPNERKEFVAHRLSTKPAARWRGRWKEIMRHPVKVTIVTLRLSSSSMRTRKLFWYGERNV